ncbi:MAG TPA: NAD(P)/FAD-dependent oxidoreductase [Caulobacteraceae bacterium]|jgi:L-2-hydroxyglutarate oxidase LhgO|nr:NAD(P)/FAD-dependent oxidoreductase [Caulobacteraceae bacterium]
MSEFDFDAAVVGAGAVGLACGYALARRGLSVVVLESERVIGQGVSSRNSEVIHAGLYYATGSLKARLCVTGRRALYAFLESHGVEFDRCGKLVVATSDAEVPVVEHLAEQGRINDVEGLAWITGAEAMTLEPALNAAAALVSPQSGVFDSHGYMRSLQGEIEDHGGAVALAAPFQRAEPVAGGGWRVRAGGKDPAELTVRLLVTAPGLDAQAVAAAIEGFPRQTIPTGHFGKGSYFALRTGKAPFARLIYPVPHPGSLGLHYRRDLGGQARFGPDLEYVDTLDYTVHPDRADEFYDHVRRYWPGLPDGALVPDYAGIRPKIHGPDEPQPDFRIDGPETHGLEGLVTLFGIESPGLTSSLAIGDEVADRLEV